MYDPMLTTPMEEELTSWGIIALKSPQEVEDFLSKDSLNMIIINSVCGCAAGSLRPGVLLSLDHVNKPENIGTVFAGVDREAVEKTRTYIPAQPSSPSVAFFKGKEIVFFIPRQDIEGQNPQQIASKLTTIFDKFC